MCFLVVINTRVQKTLNTNLEDEDDDVARERRRVTSGAGKDDVLRVENLTKVPYFKYIFYILI